MEWQPRRTELWVGRRVSLLANYTEDKERLTFELGLISEELVLVLLTALRHGPQQLGVLLVLTQGTELLITLTQLPTMPCDSKVPSDSQVP